MVQQVQNCSSIVLLLLLPLFICFFFFDGDHIGTITVLVNGERVVFVRKCSQTNQWAFHMTDVFIRKEEKPTGIFPFFPCGGTEAEWKPPLMALFFFCCDLSTLALLRPLKRLSHRPSRDLPLRWMDEGEETSVSAKLGERWQEKVQKERKKSKLRSPSPLPSAAAAALNSCPRRTPAKSPKQLVTHYRRFRQEDYSLQWKTPTELFASLSLAACHDIWKRGSWSKHCTGACKVLGLALSSSMPPTLR